MTPQQRITNGDWPMAHPRPRPNYDQPTDPRFSQMNQSYPWYFYPWAMNAQQNMYQQAQPQPQPDTLYSQDQSMSNSGLLGRYVHDISEVVPKEVPMDGRVTYFPVDDGSSVYAKYWDRTGTLQEVRYIPEVAPNEVAAMEGKNSPSFPTVQDIDATISPKLDQITDQLSNRLSQIEAAIIAMVQAGSQAGIQQPARGNQKPKKEES